MFPTSLSDISLAQWISCTAKTAPLDEVLKGINAMDAGHRKEVLLTKNHVDRAHVTAEFFECSGLETVDDVLAAYEAFCSLFADEVLVIAKDVEDITFGQFVDAKMMLQAGKDNSQWELMQYILTIFAFPDHDPKSLNEESDRFKATAAISMRDVLAYKKWWEDINTRINDTYAIFQDSGEDEGDHMKEHMQRWGWVNFLKSIATTKVFDKAGSGLNSIECARITSLDDVLMWASEEKEANIARMRDMEKR